MRRRFASLVLSAAALYGQASISGPAGQYIFDPGTQTIRAIVGAPGSGYLGNSVTPALQLGSVAPNGRFAIAVTANTAEFIADLTQSPVTTQPLAGAIADSDRILWAQDSSGAVLFSSRGRSLQFVSQINQQPIVQPSIDLSALESVREGATAREASRTPDILASVQTAALLAIDPAAKLAVIAVGGAGQSNVYLVENGIPPRLVIRAASVAAAAFAADGSLYVIDAAGDQVWMVLNPLGSATTQTLPAPQTSPGRPAAIMVEGNLLYVASGAGNKIDVYDAASLQQVDELTLDSAPTTLEQFTATSYLVNARRNSADPILLLETSPVRKIIFIPAGAKQ
jgi:DNA-binding beta-propeller fold protein YncE